MGRSPCCAKEGLNRGAWTAMEDKTLTDYIKHHGEGCWRTLPLQAGLKRSGKSCRLRWLNYLRPGIKRGNITPDEENLILRMHKLLGNRWSLIEGRVPGRTNNEIKNYWNTAMRKKFQNHQIPCMEKRTTKLSSAPLCTSPIVPIRPKVVKGTRVYIDYPLPPSLPLSLPSDSGNGDGSAMPPLPTHVPSTRNTEIMGPTPRTETNPSINDLDDFLAMDFSMMGDFDFSEFLSSPEKCYDLGHGLSNEGEPFSQLLLEDWWRS